MPDTTRDIQRYLDLIESQHQTAPRFMATLTRLLEKADGATAAAKLAPRAYYVREAAGKQLDQLGELVGCGREVTAAFPGEGPPQWDDAAFRVALLSKIVQNHWDGTVEGFRAIWNTTMRDAIGARFYDNQDMSVSLELSGALDRVLTELVLSGKVAPKPVGVRMNVRIVSPLAYKRLYAGATQMNYARIEMEAKGAAQVEQT